MQKLLAAALTATVLFLPASPAHSGPGSRGPEVQVTASADCSAEPLQVIFFIKNSGPSVLHIDGTVHIVVREPSRTPFLFWGQPASGFDVIEPGGQVRFVIPFDHDPPVAFDAERIIFAVHLEFEEKKRTVIRHTVFPGCS